MIRLEVDYEERDIPKKLGARWNRKDKFWYTNYCEDLAKFSKWLPNNHIVIDFKNILSDIGHNHLKLNNPTTYIVEGDVNQIYKAGKFGHIIKLIDNHNIYDFVMVYCSFNMKKDDEKKFKDKRIMVVGNLNIYPEKGRIQLEAKNKNDIEVIGDCTWEQDVKKWESECNDILLSKDSQEKIYFNANTTKVAVISQEGTDGYADFMKKLNGYNNKSVGCLPFETTLVEVDKFNKDELCKSIYQINANKYYDCACIIRGGGDKENLIDFSHPDVLNSIYKSQIPIITGIGHVNYRLLCNRVNNNVYSAGTPSNAGSALIWFKGHESDKDKCIRLEKENKTLSAECTRLEEENKALCEKIARLNNRSLIGRIFNM